MSIVVRLGDGLRNVIDPRLCSGRNRCEVARQPEAAQKWQMQRPLQVAW
ncbi:hypothetical protein [Roseiflexus castenholzii]|nr:hypothetical protein [Roseiflexus castenholzii]